MYELKRQRQLAALRAATGAWNLADHPELKAAGLRTSESCARKVIAALRSRALARAALLERP